jgi:hypothetical protein
MFLLSQIPQLRYWSMQQHYPLSPLIVSWITLLFRFLLIFWPDGTFTGLKDPTNGIIYFRGVRYADPPVGEPRWRAAVSPPTTHLGNVKRKLSGTAAVLQWFDFLFFSISLKFGASCIATIQTAMTSTTSEDCLFGNVGEYQLHTVKSSWPNYRSTFRVPPHRTASCRS